MAKIWRVLIVEDEQMLREAYQRILNHNGFEVAVAVNGLEGVAMLHDFQPHLVMLDMLMPQLDGVGFIRESNIRQRYPDIKVVVCTNLSDGIASGFAAKLGCRQVLKSDLSPRELVTLVQEVLDAPGTPQNGQLAIT
jgi:DNA-binding response OmpR family regulator